MKNQYSIHSTGYEPGIPFSDLTEAKLAMRDEMEESFRRARRLSKTATKHKLGENNYSITLAKDPRSTLYSTFTIVKL